MRIAYGTVETLLGELCIGVTTKGICYVGQNIRGAYPDAELVHDQKAIASSASVLKRWLDGEDVDFSVDVEGTPFQKSVWKAMSRIPRGKTRTYGELAKAIGNPKAVRAVGTACGANPVALLVPCHRVVATGGGLGGYAWGLPMKKRLLELEGACA